MLDFTFEIVDESTINTRILYANEWFTFNIYEKDHVWTLHPFDGMLIRNKDMCQLVINELLKNKYFHVMCAKENILLSELRTTVDLSNRTSISTPRPTPSPREERLDDELPDDIKSFMDYHTLDEIIDMEKQIIYKRMTFYKQMLEAMFMQGAGPTDQEFIQIQSIYVMWKESYEKLNGLSDQDLSGGKKRW
ncbi:hypothetical protein QFZ77_007030 [Paenibacillus sp. V4I3]|uniref:hypothetical protein n=1 Tax=unclassified Paenibacillus TaxID=185978 RepID=UPI00278AC67E|nr:MULTISPECIES: hypothetical protein [unclassified Paenibacillus]MDQ0878371.1 hypothetical protein [Paenibacillus sp. V4I3]MDQ0885775.1 hypothetical protein [Paenibacillus sp. V4I9]